ncbi:MAG: hypothetical protein E3J35_00705 [Methanomassiliicoccales archaeon]|nr:MAG: hypothetical protein E3J35_00705 [Methanomassiliicoccales archaeon]
MRKALLFVAIMGTLLLPTTAIGDTEPNDDFDTAEQIVAGSYDGELDCGWFSCDDYDYYRITLVAGQVIYVNVTSTPETSVTLYNEQRETKGYSGAETSHEVFRVTSSSAPASFTYYIEIHRLDGEGPYTMEVSIVSQNDANSGGDAGDRFDTATFVADGIRYSGYANSLHYDTDYYAIRIQQESQVTIDLWSNDEESAHASIDDEERHSLSALVVEYGAHDNVTFEVSEPQTVYLHISTIGTYHFQITLNPIDSTDGPFDDGSGSDVLSQLWSWLPYIIVLLILVFVVIAIIAVVKRKV